jgi:hypothetical protein
LAILIALPSSPDWESTLLAILDHTAFAWGDFALWVWLRASFGVHGMASLLRGFTKMSLRAWLSLELASAGCKAKSLIIRWLKRRNSGRNA